MTFGEYTPNTKAGSEHPASQRSCAPKVKNRVARLMQAQGLRAKASRKFKATTNSNHNLPVAPNLLEQDFAATSPNQRWISDITYITTDEGWLYLAVVLDPCMRVGWWAGPCRSA